MLKRDAVEFLVLLAPGVEASRREFDEHHDLFIPSCSAMPRRLLRTLRSGTYRGVTRIALGIYVCDSFGNGVLIGLAETASGIVPAIERHLVHEDSVDESMV